MKEVQMLKKTFGKWKALAGLFAVVFAFVLFCDAFSMVSLADSQAKITASSAKVRKEATTNSESLGSVMKDTTITVTGEEQGADGYVWYKVVVNDNLSGYIRSDLVAITEEAAEVTKVNPISGTVKGSATVRVRSNASTSSEIVRTVSSGTTLTVTGKATASDGKVWYQVSCTVDNTLVEGFIRYDYVELSGELTPYTEQPATPTEAPVEPTQEPEVPVATPTPEVQKDYDTVYQDDAWFLVETETGRGWNIKLLFEAAEQNEQVAKEFEADVKSQKVVIIILVFLLVAAAAGAGFLVFKIKDMMDSAYFNQVEAETIRRKNAAGQSKRVMHTVGGDDRKTAKPAGTPQGQRPAGTPQGQRPAGTPQGQRPAGAPQGQRPAGTPQGQRPAGAPQGQRPAGTPQGQRPAGVPQGQRPVGTPQSQRPVGSPQEQRPADATQAPKNGAQGQTWQSKNFMAEDDEFEFEFLNYDGEEEK